MIKSVTSTAASAVDKNNNMKGKYMKESCINEYCIGCGLCESIGISKLEIDSRGFSHPCQSNADILRKICPSVGIHTNVMNKDNVWGQCLEVCIGWSNNPQVRMKASSGGVLTELAAYMLENHYVDEIMHTAVDETNPTKTITVFSKTRAELESRCGSRYSISHPLNRISEIDFGKKYLFIGKPCDVIALRNYCELEPKMKKAIPYMFSFFCAGLPSNEAQNQLLQKMGTSYDECKSLVYRGNGWPGYATAVSNTGQVSKLEYRQAWGKTLGRDIMKACRVCLDGIGEMADISCGDAWYMNEDGTPDFSEHEGRNIIFARNIEGLEILHSAINDGVIYSEKIADYDTYLRKIQMYQYERKATMQTKLRILRLFGKKPPKYNSKVLKSYSKTIDGRKKRLIALGTIKRVFQGKF